MRFVSDHVGERRSQSRLADARLTRHQHHPAFAGLGLLPAAQRQLQFLITTDQRRRVLTQRLEAADRAALSNNPPCALRLGKPGERLRPEVFQIEQRADVAARAIRDD